MSVPAIFSSDVTQVTGVSWGQLPHSPEETFYYLPYNNHVKGFRATEVHVFTYKQALIRLSTWCNGLLYNRTAFSEDSSHYSWLLTMSLILNPCQQILALTFYGVFSPENFSNLCALPRFTGLCVLEEYSLVSTQAPSDAADP